ncbi:DUF7133 domain-containing protein [Flavitalea flava]
MKIIPLSLSVIGFSILIINVFFLYCRPDQQTSSVVSPEESIRKMVVVDGFTVKLVAAEPLVSTPVALDFDYRGRIWVVEMQGYMPDAEGVGEDRPDGKIVILQDTDGDGIADKRTVFLDSLVLPRAICLIEKGVLIAAPPCLWYMEIENDRPSKRVLVDSAYTDEGNVEEQANGLLRGLDNWIYSACSAKRYRKRGEKWLIERTHFRGQWGITRDDYGRVYYNNNTQNLLGDYFAPGAGSANGNMREVKGFNEKIVEDTRVYPIRPTPGVNRGYMKDILDDGARLVNLTAACGPQIYRGGLFGKEYNGNAFIAEPAANLIKRNILEENGFKVVGRQAYRGKEFLASTDERFRPVNLYNGPDGALYIVDMYRGIIQHKFFLTDYLKKQIKDRGLWKPINCGRIYKVVPKDKIAAPVIFPEDPVLLVELLDQESGWIRDRVQQKLIDEKYTQALPALRNNLTHSKDPLTVIHSLWTIEGLGALSDSDLVPLLKNPDWKIRVQALQALPSINDYRQILPVLQQMISDNDSLAAPYIAFELAAIRQSASNDLLLVLAQKYPDNPYVTDAIISNLKDRELQFYKELLATDPDTSHLLASGLRTVIGNIAEDLLNKDRDLLVKSYPKGAALFKNTCQTCHGADGNGVSSLAPPLNRSQWVNGDKDKLISIVLYGLTGPVKVNNKLYRTPEINGDMPGLGTNKSIRDEDLAQVLSFIRKSWSNHTDSISVTDIVSIRKRWKDRQKSFTTTELEK